ncbi:hypothetical protein XENTR_v10009750 [Xenopus tropicalis]|nr:hypothetical protein XENTR_v10009750 [Xenopus tropicalis]
MLCLHNIPRRNAIHYRAFLPLLNGGVTGLRVAPLFMFGSKKSDTSDSFQTPALLNVFSFTGAQEKAFTCWEKRIIFMWPYVKG